jgi:hypothetical protein
VYRLLSNGMYFGITQYLDAFTWEEQTVLESIIDYLLLLVRSVATAQHATPPGTGTRSPPICVFLLYAQRMFSHIFHLRIG